MWSSSDTCTGLPNLQNILTDTTFPVIIGTKIELSCTEGYTFQGDTTITCIKDTTFTIGTPPTCHLDSCHGPPFVDYLQVETAFPVVYGTPVKVSCGTDWDLLGSQVIYCEQGITYRYGRRPQCVNKGKDDFWRRLHFDLKHTVFDVRSVSRKIITDC